MLVILGEDGRIRWAAGPATAAERQDSPASSGLSFAPDGARTDCSSIGHQGLAPLATFLRPYGTEFQPPHSEI